MWKRLLLFADALEKPVTHWGKLFFLSGIVGVLAGTAAACLEMALRYGSGWVIGRFAPTASGQVFVMNGWVLVLPAVGGLLAGLVVSFLCGGQREHGTNQYITAFHNHGGALALRNPAIKAATAVGLIAFGGSAGPEGPIAALGAAIGSAVGRGFDLPPRLRRVLLVAGCGGGVGAVFQCPLGGALFAASVLYRDPELDADSIVPAIVSSVLSYSTFMAFPTMSGHMLAGADRLRFSSAWELLPYAMLGPMCGLLSIFYRFCVQAVESRARKAHASLRWMTPAIGGLFVGALACVLPQVIDGQYQLLQNALDGTLFTHPSAALRTWWAWAGLFAAIALIKCVATALTVGTSAAGGLLGPSVFIGGAAGAALGAVLEAVWPGPVSENLRGSLIAVGMAGVLSASMRIPMAAIVMVTEMTGSYGLIVPLMLVCVTAYIVGRRWGLNEAQVRSASESPAHAGDVLVHMLEGLRVRDVMDGQWPYCAGVSSSLKDLLAPLPSRSRPVFPVLDGDRLVGVISSSDIARVLNQPGFSSLFIASDIMRPRVISVDPDDSVYEALELFRATGHEILPVVEINNRYLGVLQRQSIHDAVRTRLEELRSVLRHEHGGLTALDQDAQFYQLALGVSVPRGDTIQRTPVPPEAIGKSLRKADFRNVYQAQVIAVQELDGTLVCPPDVDRPLEKDQLLLVIPQA